jgi:hypothetical protein
VPNHNWSICLPVVARLTAVPVGGLDRNEFGALLVAARLGPPAEQALIFLLALNGLRMSEATGAG